MGVFSAARHSGPHRVSITRVGCRVRCSHAATEIATGASGATASEASAGAASPASSATDGPPAWAKRMNFHSSSGGGTPARVAHEVRRDLDQVVVTLEDDGTTVTALLDGEPVGRLTSKMGERYRPMIQELLDAGYSDLRCEARIIGGKKKIDTFLKLATPWAANDI